MRREVSKKYMMSLPYNDEISTANKTTGIVAKTNPAKNVMIVTRSDRLREMLRAYLESMYFPFPCKTPNFVYSIHATCTKDSPPPHTQSTHTYCFLNREAEESGEVGKKLTGTLFTQIEKYMPHKLK